MSLPEKIDLSLYSDKREFLIKTAQQLEKDFESEGFKFELSEKDVTYNSLYEIIYPHIEKLLNTQPYKLQQLIYRIDLPEKAYNDTVQKSTEPASELTQLIIQRELLKVVIRHHYSSK
jgi:endonuclease III